MTDENKRQGMAAEPGNEKDLDQLRESAKKTYEALRDADENDFPPARRQEYWSDRNLARKAWEQAENAVFANLVEEQKRRLPEVAASNAKLAKDVQATANVLAMLDVITASLNVVADVITLLARVALK